MCHLFYLLLKENIVIKKRSQLVCDWSYGGERVANEGEEGVRCAALHLFKRERRGTWLLCREQHLQKYSPF